MSTTRYGIAETYGMSFAALSPEEIRGYMTAPFREQPCRFRGPGAKCNKSGGVCSLRPYVRNEASAVVPFGKDVATTCPMRFHEDNTVFSWIGEELLGCSNPRRLDELPFLQAKTSDDDLRTVGKIDSVLVHPDTSRLRWCALEMQAVYFSGPSLADEQKELANWQGPGLPFPSRQRRPDFRSSGPKRLMPQLQIKVPTISRWGKKTAVVVDRCFWQSLGRMTEVPHKTNCDIAWFVVDYADTGRTITLRRHELHLTTLDRAVEGLTGGTPTSLEAFEETLRNKLSAG